MEFTVNKQYVVFLLIALLLCGCPNGSSQSQPTDSGNVRQSGAASSNTANNEPAKDDPANPGWVPIVFIAQAVLFAILGVLHLAKHS